VRRVDEMIGCILNSSRILSRKRRLDIQRELRAHIEDFVLAARDAGRGDDEIEKLVLANFGDPRHIAESFAWVYRHERRRLRAVAYTLSTVLLASSLLAAILAAQAGLAFGFGMPIMRLLASRHTAIEALDILASVAAYLGLISLENLFENHRFPKAAFLLGITLAMLMASSAAAGLHTPFLVFGVANGVFFRAVQLFVTPKVARTGIVLICFPLVGLVSALLRSPLSQVPLAATCASWLIMGAGYQLMTHLAARVDSAVLNRLQRI
jgi:hypothetical protein